MAESTKAIFLSYARDDAAAARRIAEALRSSGLEVWFDENELRGGDAWDSKIRRQINDCTLFVPLISQHTEARTKGYFRLEWKLAVEQTHLLAEGVPFIAPVTIDDTRETGAVVPAEFLRVQWTRLPGALPTPQFVEQIKRLLTTTVAPGVTAPPLPLRATTTALRDEGVASPGKPSRTPLMLVAAVAVAAIGAAVYFALRPGAKETPAATAATPEPAARRSAPPTPEKSAPPAVSDKSIAVLPFTNMSDDKDANAFFADGIHEDILTNLAHISELRVVSRTSVMEYRGTKENVRTIAQKLGVTYLLEGSVRRAGNKVRVTGQLIRAATDEHVWAETYTKDLTDVFTIQSELAQKIAAALQTALSPREKKLISQRPTENPVAYDLYLKARALERNIGGRTTIREQEKFLQEAVALDPAFVFGWTQLAITHASIFDFRLDPSEARVAKAQAAIDTAIRLAPDDPAVIRALGEFYYRVHRDFPRAVGQFQKLLVVQPNDPNVYSSLLNVQMRQGRWADALANARKAHELDPGAFYLARGVARFLRESRRYAEAVTAQRRLIELRPDDLSLAYELAYLSFLASGSTREVEAFFAGLKAGVADSEAARSLRRSWAATQGKTAEPAGAGGPDGPGSGLPQAIVLATQGNQAAARAWLEKRAADFRARLVQEPANDQLWGQLGVMEAISGHPEEALRCARKAVELVPEALNARAHGVRSQQLAFVYAWTGDKDRAIAEYARLLRVCPLDLHVYEMRHHRAFFPLQGDPRFEALLNDPKNNAPLF